MKMPNQMSVAFTHKITVQRPIHPIKGSLFGVGKKYRANCRHWQRTVKQWEKSPKVTTHTTYIPVAEIEVVMARNEEDAEVRQTTKSVTAEFTIKPTNESRGLFYGN